MDETDRMVGQVAAALSAMTHDDIPVPGTLLDRMLTEGAGVVGEVVAFTCELLDVSVDVADTVLARLSEVIEFTGPVVDDLGRL